MKWLARQNITNIEEFTDLKKLMAQQRIAEEPKGSALISDPEISQSWAKAEPKNWTHLKEFLPLVHSASFVIEESDIPAVKGPEIP